MNIIPKWYNKPKDLSQLCDEKPTIELLPDGFAKSSNGKWYRRMKWDGPNYSYRTPVQHVDRMRSGAKYDLYEINPSRPNQALPGFPTFNTV